MTPYPGPRSVIVLDNAAIHSPILKMQLAVYGIRMEFLPPYCPIFNPIEECFGIIKKYLRRHYLQLRLRPVHHAIIEACSQITHETMEGLFRKDGYYYYWE